MNQMVLQTQISQDVTYTQVEFFQFSFVSIWIDRSTVAVLSTMGILGTILTTGKQLLLYQFHLNIYYL